MVPAAALDDRICGAKASDTATDYDDLGKQCNPPCARALRHALEFRSACGGVCCASTYLVHRGRMAALCYQYCLPNMLIRGISGMALLFGRGDSPM